ncbi:MAG: hypothetical protein LBI87_05705 [Candidatus Accumulibacter sp.]|nr:hypothetical protein [Accumulibacter sp.]
MTRRPANPPPPAPIENARSAGRRNRALTDANRQRMAVARRRDGRGANGGAVI